MDSHTETGGQLRRFQTYLLISFSRVLDGGSQAMAADAVNVSAFQVWVSRWLSTFGNLAGGISPLKKWNWCEQESHEMSLQIQLTVTNTEHGYNSLPTVTFPVGCKSASSPRGTRVWNTLYQRNMFVSIKNEGLGDSVLIRWLALQESFHICLSTSSCVPFLSFFSLKMHLFCFCPWFPFFYMEEKEDCNLMLFCIYDANYSHSQGWFSWIYPFIHSTMFLMITVVQLSSPLKSARNIVVPHILLQILFHQ